MIYKDISEQIEELRCKLHKELEKSGFDTKKALKLSEELDELIENFYVEKNMKKTNDNNNFTSCGIINWFLDRRIFINKK